MDEVELVVKLPASAAGAVPDGSADTAAYEVIGKGEFSPSWKWDRGVGFHGDEAVFSVPSVGEASVEYQIAVEVVAEGFRGGGEEFSSFAGGGAVGIGGGDGVGDVDFPGAGGGEGFVEIFVEAAGWGASDCNRRRSACFADDIEGAGNGAVVDLIEWVGSVNRNASVSGDSFAVADLIEAVGVAPTGDGGVRWCGFFAGAGDDFALIVIAVVPASVVFAGDFFATVHGVELGDAEGLELRGIISVGDAIETVRSVIAPRGGEESGAAGFESDGLDCIGVCEVCVIGGFCRGGNLMQSGVGPGFGVFCEM